METHLDERANLYHGDFYELIKSVPDSSVDMVCTDPPYGVTNCNWDVKIDLDKMWEELKRVGKPNACYAFTATFPFAFDLIAANRKMFRYDLVWAKGNSSTGFLNANRMPLRCHENILIFYQSLPTYNPQKTEGIPYVVKQNGSMCKRTVYSDVKKTDTECLDGRRHPKSVIEINPNKGKAHNTQKPVALMEWLIRSYTNKDEMVLDPFAGSASTGVAAIKSGRRFIGFEKDKDIYDVAAKRIEQEESVLRLF